MSDKAIQMQENGIRQIFVKEIALIISVVSIAFGVFSYVTTPERANKEQLEYLKGVIEKNQTVQDTLTKTQQNDLHTIEGKLEQQNVLIQDLTNQLTRLETILSERLPVAKK